MNERRTSDRRISPAIGEFAIQQAPALGAEIDRLRIINAELVKVCHAAVHALRSYQYGNSATDLAEETANACESAIAKVQP